jgi:hypothetical protein
MQVCTNNSGSRLGAAKRKLDLSRTRRRNSTISKERPRWLAEQSQDKTTEESLL